MHQIVYLCKSLFMGDFSHSMIKASIIGASGYSGAELLRLLSFREDVRVEQVIAGSSVGQRVDALYPALTGIIGLEYEPLEARQRHASDITFVALPSGEAMKVVPQVIQDSPRIIDLSGDFRLSSVETYEEFYNHPHTAPHFLDRAVYGLPELNKARIAGAQLVANPGCYPTGAILALLPALKHELIAPTGIVINSLSGVSGAGRSASVEMSFAEVNENIRAYKIGTHQHIPEIEQVLTQASGEEVSVSFVPHLVPLTRGIYTTIHAHLNIPVSPEEVCALYEQWYEGAPFVRVKRQVPQIKDVAYTNYCDIGVSVEKRTNQLIIVSVIDNLVKGAAGQALQNMNIMFGLPEHLGLR